MSASDHVLTVRITALVNQLHAFCVEHDLTHGELVAAVTLLLAANVSTPEDRTLLNLIVAFLRGLTPEQPDFDFDREQALWAAILEQCELADLTTSAPVGRC